MSNKKTKSQNDANPLLSDVKISHTERRLMDYDVWYKKCERCGYDAGKSNVPKIGNKTCWKCGDYVSRDYSDRALKKGK
jgi:hypothetical protein